MAKIYFPQYSKGRKTGIDPVVGKSILEHIKKSSGIETGNIHGDCVKDITRLIINYTGNAPGYCRNNTVIREIKAGPVKDAACRGNNEASPPIKESRIASYAFCPRDLKDPLASARTISESTSGKASDRFDNALSRSLRYSEKARFPRAEKNRSPARRGSSRTASISALTRRRASNLRVFFFTLHAPPLHIPAPRIGSPRGTEREASPRD